MLRFLNNKKISDKISTRSILQKMELLSVNQLIVQIKLGDMWKATHIDNYPTKITMLKYVVNPVNTRACANGNLLLNGNSTITQETFINNARKA